MIVHNRKLIGHKEQKKFIMVNYDKISVWLWNGIEGIGKASLFRSFVCWALETDDINHPNVHCLDCKGVRIAELRDFTYSIFRFANMKQRKFIMFDNFHLMPERNQKVLLKLLEGIPRNVMVVIISHDLSRVLDTVISRSFVLNFNALTESQIAFVSDITDKSVIALSYGSVGRALYIKRNNGIVIFRDILRSISESGIPYIMPSISYQSEKESIYNYMLQCVVHRIIMHGYGLIEEFLFPSENLLLENCKKFFQNSNDLYVLQKMIRSYFDICKFVEDKDKYYMNNYPIYSLL
ncbi:hypothetical protein GUI12_00060 [Anaplasmataceae bacterium AB001_6]|nr:hypothetical protein GUI12_00060 [Anaplasmataceae bacterium AB001_6]